MKLSIISFLSVLAVASGDSYLRSSSSNDVDLEPTWCASLAVFKDPKCKEGPVRSVVFPTYNETGSPCYHDMTMGRFSVKNQYCNPETGNWHEEVYPGPECCLPKWKKKFLPIELTFTEDSCIGGFVLNYCKEGPCSEADQDAEFMSHEDAQQLIQRHLSVNMEM